MTTTKKQKNKKHKWNDPTNKLSKPHEHINHFTSPKKIKMASFFTQEKAKKMCMKNQEYENH